MSTKLFFMVQDRFDSYQWDEVYVSLDTTNPDDAPVFDALNEGNESGAIELCLGDVNAYIA